MSMFLACALTLAVQDQDKRIEELERQVRLLMEEVEKLKKERAEAPPAKPAEKPTDVGFEFKDGLKFESADGNFKGHIGGRVIEHARVSLDRPDDTTAGDRRPDGFFVRQARLEMSGLFYKQFEFKVQMDAPTAAAADGGTLQDGYIGWVPMKEFNLRFGQFKEPFSQEEITSTRFIDFVDRSVLNRLVPGRDIGIMVHGNLFEAACDLHYEVAVFNGSGRAIFDTDDEKDVAARLQAYPLKSIDSDWTKGLRVGVAGTVGSADQESAYPDYVVPDTTTRWLDVDATVLNKGARERLGFEMAWNIGPVGLRGEYATRSSEVRETTAGVIRKDRIRDEAWYAAATWLVTGEAKPMDGRVAPAEPFDVEAGTWGAFELALRYAMSRTDDDIFANGFATGSVGTATDNTDRIDSLTAGFNWYLSRNFRFSFNWVHNWFADDVLFGAVEREDEEDVMMMRFQIDF